eukprot:COSAG02_NODE_8900_length_2405_cov_1.730269_2_plen_92_part_00
MVEVVEVVLLLVLLLLVLLVVLLLLVLLVVEEVEVEVVWARVCVGRGPSSLEAGSERSLHSSVPRRGAAQLTDQGLNLPGRGPWAGRAGDG